MRIISMIFTLLLLMIFGQLSLAEPTTQPTNSAIIPVPKLEQDSYNWEARHRAVLDVGRTIKPEVVMIGDSITHFWGGEPKARNANGPLSWKALFEGHPVLNMGFGWDRTQNVLWRLDQGEFDGLKPRFVVLNIGTNNFTGTKNARENTPAEIAEAIGMICDKLHAMSPDTKIVLMGVLPRGADANNPFRAKIAALNKILVENPTKSAFITFLDLQEQFLKADGSLPKELMGDGTHPTEKGYQIWADALKPILFPEK